LGFDHHQVRARGVSRCHLQHEGAKGHRSHLRVGQVPPPPPTSQSLVHPCLTRGTRVIFTGAKSHADVNIAFENMCAPAVPLLPSPLPHALSRACIRCCSSSESTRCSTRATRHKSPCSQPLHQPSHARRVSPGQRVTLHGDLHLRALLPPSSQRETTMPKPDAALKSSSHAYSISDFYT
jgi:hypothetical protein